MAKIDFAKIEEKWRKRWEKAKLFKAHDKSKKPKFYVLEMYPYPSGTAAHVGHARNYVMGDVLARFKRMQGYNVLYPMGWDSFGLPTENAAIEKGIHPTKSIAENIKVMKEQFAALSLSHDWTRELATHEPEYYKWTQWLFLKLYENGLAYKKLAPGNWCPHCTTVIANEDVKDGRCWRCGTEIIRKEIEQWFFKITAYADELLKGLDNIQWSERLKTLQRNWIGKSHGIEIYFKEAESREILPVFTTRPDTLFGCTFLVMAPEHPKVKELVKGTKYEKEVDKFLERTKRLSELDRISKEKDGLFIGKYAINPINNEKVPIYIANFVLMDYGTGMIMAVPAHDQRDFEFAKKYNIPIKVVIQPHTLPLHPEKMTRAFTENGVLVNSGQFDGLENIEAIEKISNYLEERGLGKRKVYYKIRDWCISRQRYWGAPIPIIYCEKCGTIPVPEKDLPVKLPLNVDFTSGKEIAPLATNKRFVNTKCPKCGGRAKREVDTMTTFVDSSWYYLRYCSPKYKKGPFDKVKVDYWMPVDQYIGGIEHAVGHLLYARFITKFLKKIGYLNFDEPFMRLLNQGMVLKGGVKMSKSKGNTVDPRPIIKEHGVDTLRTYLMFMAQPDRDVEWSDQEMFGISKFITKVLQTFPDLKEDKRKKKYIESITQRKIEIVTKHLEKLEFNKALIELIDFSNKIEKAPSKYAIKIFLQMLTPFAPHTCEEVWAKIGGKGLICASKWPKPDKRKINEEAEKAEEAINKTVADIFHILKIVKKRPKKIFVYVIPPEFKMYKDIEKDLSEEFKAEVRVFASNDPKKYDPEGKAAKAKPGKPGIYVE